MAESDPTPLRGDKLLLPYYGQAIVYTAGGVEYNVEWRDGYYNPAGTTLRSVGAGLYASQNGTPLWSAEVDVYLDSTFAGLVASIEADRVVEVPHYPRRRPRTR